MHTAWLLVVIACAPTSDPVEPLSPSPTTPTVPTAPRPEPEPEPEPEPFIPEVSVVWPGVVLNEILPANDSIVADEAREFDDYAELYNPTSAAVDLSGWGLADDAEDPDWVFPAGTTIEAGAHLLVWLDDQPDQGPLHATVGLAADGDALVLFSPDGAIADQWSFVDHPDDVVLGRFPSGGAWAPSTMATPGNFNPSDAGTSVDPSDALFPTGKVIRIDLTVNDTSWDSLMADGSVEVPVGIGFESAYLDATMSIKGGWGSLRSFDQKAAFRIDLDSIVAGQRLRGLENLTLNSMVQDPSNIHEMLAYRLLREAGAPAPRTAHVELWMNGAYRGLYLNVESPDDQFLKRWFDDPEGNLYEGAYGPDFTADGVWSLELDEQGPNQPDDRSDLAPLVALLAQPPSEDLMPSFEALVDLDRTLPMLAGEVITSHWDGYFYYPNNYRAYVEPTTGKLTLLAWGMDQTFGWAYGIHEPYGDIAEWCLQVPSCRARYDVALADMADRLTALNCADRINEIFPLIRPLYNDDPLREAGLGDMDSSIRGTIDNCESFPAAVLAQLP
jgi:hypothetical protein